MRQVVRYLLLCLLFQVSILIDKAFCLCVCYSQISVLTEKTFCLCVCYLQMYTQTHKTLLLCFVFANAYIKNKIFCRLMLAIIVISNDIRYFDFVFT